MCITFAGASTAVYVLPGSDLHRHVPAEQQFPVSAVPSQPATGVLRAGTEGHAQHRRPTTVSLH